MGAQRPGAGSLLPQRPPSVHRRRPDRRQRRGGVHPLPGEAVQGEGEVYHFHGDPALAHTLPAGGFDVATVANNHTFDYGQTGFDDTLAALADAGIGVFGTGYEGEGSGYDLILVRKVKGVTFGFVGYQAWTHGPEMVGRIHRDFAACGRPGHR